MTKLFIPLFLALSISAVAQKPPIKVLIVGTYHMSGEGKFSYTDILTSKKQKAIATIVSQLKSFAPDQIFIENPPINQPIWDSLLAMYKKGRLPDDTILYANEIFQLGIKVAALLNHSSIYPVNYDLPNPYDTSVLLKTAMDSSYVNYLREIYATAKTTTDKDWESETLSLVEMKLQKLYDSIPLADLRRTLLQMNTQTYRRYLAYKAAYGNMDNDPKGIGAEITNIQQFRNMKIYQNIVNRLNPNARRILIIYGASHNEPLRNLFEFNPGFTMVEVKDYIR
jgi:Family of unknown function (DUF5694)